MTDLIRRELELAASPLQVWAAVTDPAWLQEWLAESALLELWPGGDARFVVDGQDRTGWVEEVSAPPADGTGEGRLAFWWGAADEPASRVELTLIPLAAGTRLQVIETRPLQALDLVGVPLPGIGGRGYGPALVAA